MRFLAILPSQSLLVLAADILLSTGVYLGATYLLFAESTALYLTDSAGWLRVLLAVLSILGGLYFNELYNTLRVTSRVALALQLSHVFGLSLVVQTLLAYLYPPLALPRREVLIATLAGFPAIFLWRLAYSGFLWNLFGQQNVLLVGSGALARDLAREMAARPERGMRLVGYVGDPVSQDLLPGAYLGPASHLAVIAAQLKPDRVVVASSGEWDETPWRDMPIEDLLSLRHHGVPIEEGSRTFEALCSRICSSEFRPSQFIFDNTLVHRPGSLALQSIYINLLALAGLVAASPLLIVLAILVKLSSRGPVLDRLPCIGYRGIPFFLHRFRISQINAAGQRVFLTPLGKFLHRTHLDLLPALFNLLRGEMALVGPRPYRPEISGELAARIPFYEQRYALRPGLTGWSQINMDDSSSPADALVSLEYDLYYLKNMSLSLDAYILLHRVRHILTFGNAPP